MKFRIELIMLLAAMLGCSAIQSPEQHFPVSETSRFLIRKIFHTESVGNFPDSMAALFPNPYNHNDGDSSIAINFTLRDTGDVKIIIQNPIGDSIAIFRDSLLPPGSFSGFWNPVTSNGIRLRAGLYFITMRAAPDDPNRNYINSQLLDILSND